MIYDQGLVVELPSRSAKYAANFRYSLKPSVTADKYDSLKCSSYESFDSVCDQTMVGVKFGTDGKSVQCWLGYQNRPLTTRVARETNLFSDLILAQTSASHSQPAPRLAQTQVHSHTGSLLKEISEEDRISFAQTINSANLGWTADPYVAR